MTQRTLKVAQIGCGAHAEAQDLPNYASNPSVDCKWCCDVSLERARTLATRFGVPFITDDIAKVMADPEVDFVKIATSHEAHLEIIERAAIAGKHVFCEKPMAMDTPEALHIISAVRRGGVKLCVNLNRRQAPAIKALHTRWQAHLEEPRHNVWRYREADRELYPEELQTQFLVRVQDDTLSYRMVHLDPLRGGGQIIGESVHWIDLACWWFAPQIPVEIQAWGSTRFSHGIHLVFSGGDNATILFHCGGTFDYPKELYEITSHGALFRSKCFVENQYFGMPGVERETFAWQCGGTPELESLGFNGYAKQYRERVENLSNSKEGNEGLAMDKGHRAMFDAFVQSLLHDTPSPCDEMAGYQSTLLAQLAIQSIETRQSLPVLRERIQFTVL